MAPVKPFVLMPAIDLRGGRVVRLRQGDFDRETIYGDDPVDVAVGFAGVGATWLHVVDLDGARSGSPQQAAVIAAIVEAVGDRLDVQVGGGLRDEASVAAVLAMGAARVVVGTAAIDDPRFAGRLVGASRSGKDRRRARCPRRACDRLGLADRRAWRPGHRCGDSHRGRGSGHPRRHGDRPGRTPRRSRPRPPRTPGRARSRRGRRVGRDRLDRGRPRGQAGRLRGRDRRTRALRRTGSTWAGPWRYSVRRPTL